MKFLFGDIVVVNKNEIGVVVKAWENMTKRTYSYEVYSRMTGTIETYPENDVERYRARHKWLSEEEMEYQWGGM